MNPNTNVNENNWFDLLDATCDTRCPQCEGTGRTEDNRPCPECGGTGEIDWMEVQDVV